MMNCFTSPRVATQAVRYSRPLRQRLPIVRPHSSLIFTQHDYDRLQEENNTMLNAMPQQQDLVTDEYYPSAAARADTMQSLGLKQDSTQEQFPSLLQERNGLAQEVFKACDADGDGKISLEEFEHGLEKLQRK